MSVSSSEEDASPKQFPYRTDIGSRRWEASPLQNSENSDILVFLKRSPLLLVSALKHQVVMFCENSTS